MIHCPKILKYWLPPLLWMVVIFSVSSDAQSYQHTSRFLEPLLHWLLPSMPFTYIQTIHFLVRKSAHMTEYALLALLFWRAIRTPPGPLPRPWSWTEAAMAVGLVLIYAATDELHQHFVPGRTGQFSDVAVDVTGAIVGIILLWIYTQSHARLGLTDRAPGPPMLPQSGSDGGI